MLGVHYCLALWALAWLQMKWIIHAIAFGLSSSGAAGTALLLRGLFKIFHQNKHDMYTLFLTFSAAIIIIACMTCSAALGYFRANLITMKLTEPISSVIIQGAPVKTAETEGAVSDFYKRATPLLGIIFPLSVTK